MTTNHRAYITMFDSLYKFTIHQHYQPFDLFPLMSCAHVQQVVFWLRDIPIFLEGN